VYAAVLSPLPQRRTIDPSGLGEEDAMAEVDYFIKFDGIKGESTDAKHKDEIDVESWSWGETNVGTGPAGGGAGAGKVSMHDFHFVMGLNRASIDLMKACATGQHIKTATLSARKAGKGQQEYLTFKFYDVLVSSYQTGGSEAALVPTDAVSFNFAKLEVEYKPQLADGSLAAGVQFKYDLKTNKTF
jgi:type VI secretion system secreted protein Hcp